MTQTRETTHAEDQAAMLITLRRAQAAIRLLPYTSSGVAATLAELRILGHSLDPNPDAFTMYLEALTGHRPRVDHYTAEFGTTEWAFTLSLPRHVSAFLYRYERGDFPELLGPPSGGHATILSDSELSGLTAEEG